MLRVLCIVMIFIPIKSFSQQTNDTAEQSIYYQKTLIKKGKIEMYGYSSFNLNWYDESGIGIVYYIRHRNKKKHKVKGYE
jgi:hypothetical protein